MAKGKEVIGALVILVSFYGIAYSQDWNILDRRRESPSLVAYYKFDDGRGPRCIDLSGHANHGSLRGGPHGKGAAVGKDVDWRVYPDVSAILYPSKIGDRGPNWVVEGKEKTALKFDGIDDWVEVYDSASLCPRNQITIEAWVKGPLQKDGPIIAKEKSYVFGIEDRKVKFIVNTVSGNALILIGQGKVPSDSWTHLAATFDGQRLKVYLNGELDGGKDGTGNIFISPLSLMIAHNPPDKDYFQGIIDEVKIYDRALRPEEIRDDLHKEKEK